MPKFSEKMALRTPQKWHGSNSVGVNSASRGGPENPITNQKGGESQSSVSLKSMTRSTVASQFSKFSIGSRSSKDRSKGIIGRIKSVGRKKDKKRSSDGSEVDTGPVPGTVSARTVKQSNKLALAKGGNHGDPGSVTSLSGAVHLVHVVLFLVDPKTSRFEVLLLDFNSSRARVRDILTQIRVASKEETFRKQRFSGISDEDGCEMIDSHKISDYTSEWAVAIAIPDGMTSKESARMARPLINDSRVDALLRRHKSSKSMRIDVEKSTKDDKDEKAFVAASNPEESAVPVRMCDQNVHATRNEHADASKVGCRTIGGSSSYMIFVKFLLFTSCLAMIFLGLKKINSMLTLSYVLNSD